MFWIVTKQLLQGLQQTTELFAVTLLASLPLGLLISFGLMSQWQPFRTLGVKNPKWRTFRPISAFFELIVWIIRGTPLMLQLIVIFYGPGMWFGHNIWGSNGRMVACAIAFIINYSCYFAVIYRGGIEGVPVGQSEAGAVLGMTKSQIFFRVTLLQMIKRIVPPMSNEIITLVKDTSLARIIAISELIKAGESFIKSKGITWPLFYTGVYYLLFVGILTLLFRFIEKKLSYFR